MSDTIQIKGGSLGERAEMPALGLRELGFQSDKEGGALYIGTASGNLLLCTFNRTGGDFDRVTAATSVTSPTVLLSSVTELASSQNGMIFESENGKLSYRNSYGAVNEISGSTGLVYHSIEW